MMAKKKIDLASLTPDVRKKVERAIEPRDKILAVRVSEAKLEEWAKKAKAAGFDKLAEWVRARLDD